MSSRFQTKSASLVLGFLLAVTAAGRAAAVRVTEREIQIPTYLAGEPEPNPMFYFGRGSQGAQGRIYPYPLYDSLLHTKSNKSYRIVYLENEYVRVGILPEIGGRLFEAVDKSNNYDFIYRQHVIKPALIGLIGAWISGGIEWNIPHHHRATTFLPVQYRVESSRDGSQTVWVGELELRDRMRWAVGYTLHPGKSYLECSVRILNRTPVANSMLCFANVAVHVNNDYQVIYPPSTRFVTFHSKREFTTWPIANSVYNGADFTRGVDVSWYSNHVTANSLFAWNYQDDFFAGYDHGKQAGIVSVADHHVVPGKKFWTWGNGPRGRMWDKILTDNDGPYIELMTGAYSDNQPDYSWLQPYETRSFQMCWYPFHGIGGVKEANLDAAVNLEVATNFQTAKVGFCTTAAHESALVSLRANGKVLLEERVAINPGKPYTNTVQLPAGVDQYGLRASLSADGRELVAYAPQKLAPAKAPEPYKAPPAPSEIKTIEELYLAGQRIEQFHSPNNEPEPYWEEALRRDPGDARVNTVLGIRKLKQARFVEAETHFRKAIERLTANYTTPKDAEPFYYLGLALQQRSWNELPEPGARRTKLDEAFDAFYHAAWSEGWKGPAYFSLAEIAAYRGDFTTALGYVDRSLAANELNVRAQNLKAALLRRLERPKEALALLAGAAQATDPLDVRLLTERWLAGSKSDARQLANTLREFPNTGLETAAEFARAGLWRDGLALLELQLRQGEGQTNRQPLAWYYLAYFAEQLHDSAKAADYRRLAAQAQSDYVFPFQWEMIPVLRRAIAANPNDPRAPYYLGNLLFDGQPAETVKLWEKSAALDPSFAIVHRNLAQAYEHQKPNPDLPRAIAQMEQAVACPQRYGQHLAELDELYARTSTAPEHRLVVLEQNHQLVLGRDEALTREIGLKVFAGKYDEAIGLMTDRQFAVWEGGSQDVATHWVNAHLLRGQQKLAIDRPAAALTSFLAAAAIPDNLPTEERNNDRGPELAYWIGTAREALNEIDKARESWTKAAAGAAPARPRKSPGRFSESRIQVYYQALAKRKLGDETGARELLRSLLDQTNEALQASTSTETSTGAAGKGSAPNPQAAVAHYAAGLAKLGLGQNEFAKQEFVAALAARPDYVPASYSLKTLAAVK